MNIVGENVIIKVPSGNLKHNTINNNEQVLNKFIETDYQNSLLTDIVQSYGVGDLCLIGKLSY